MEGCILDEDFLPEYVNDNHNCLVQIKSNYQSELNLSNLSTITNDSLIDTNSIVWTIAPSTSSTPSTEDMMETRMETELFKKPDDPMPHDASSKSKALNINGEV